MRDFRLTPASRAGEGKTSLLHHVRLESGHAQDNDYNRSGASVSLPPEALDALGVEPGAELEVEIIGRALVVRSVEEARRSREFIDSFESILAKRRSAYDELAKGPDDSSRAE